MIFESHRSGGYPTPVTAGKRPSTWRFRPSGVRDLRSRAADADSASWPLVWVGGFLVVHVGLALLMKRFSAVATVHALATLAYGFWLCRRRNCRLQIAQWVAYVVGAEVVWRMCQAPIPWEFAKHSIWIVGVVALGRSSGAPIPWAPPIYFLLQFPASLLTFTGLPFDMARKLVSFYLSGPLCLVLCVMLYSTLRLTASGFRHLTLMCLAPVVGAASIIVAGISSSEVSFTSGSNAALSGGYGPNQVSSALSLGAVLAIFSYFVEDRSKALRYGTIGIAMWLLAQSALTFSRTGLYLFGAAFGVAGVFLLQWKRRGRHFLFLLLALGAATVVILPLMDAYTKGKLSERFADKGLTHRDDIAKQDLLVWRAHPVFGAGTGMSSVYRDDTGTAAHTEYTRLVADHGFFGLVALIFLIVMTWQAFRRAQAPWAKAIVSAFSIWAFLFMAGTAMRLAAPAFLLGLIHAQFASDGPAAASVRRPTRAPKVGWLRNAGLTP